MEKASDARRDRKQELLLKRYGTDRVPELQILPYEFEVGFTGPDFTGENSLSAFFSESEIGLEERWKNWLKSIDR